MPYTVDIDETEFDSMGEAIFEGVSRAMEIHVGKGEPFPLVIECRCKRRKYDLNTYMLLVNISEHELADRVLKHIRSKKIYLPMECLFF